MTTLNRRDFLLTSAGVGLAALTAETCLAKAQETLTMNPTFAPAFAANHEAKPLAFDPAKLEGLSEKLMRSHWENNYGGTVKTLNAVKQQLASLQEDSAAPAFIYNGLKREHLMRTGSVVLHELYFGNLGGRDQPDATTQKAFAQAFGSQTRWEKEFRRIGVGLGGGCGWVTLGYNLHSGLLENYWQADHMHAPMTTLPILVMDMYEHSYQMDYGAATAGYIDAFFRNIHWETVAKRLEKAVKARELWSVGGLR